MSVQGDTVEEARAPASRRPSGGTRPARVAVAVVAALLAALVATRQVIGTHPRLVEDGVSWWGTGFAADAEGSGDPVGYTAWDAGSDGATFEILLRNPARYPVTVTGVDDVALRVTFIDSTMPGGLDGSGHRPESTTGLRVPAGGSFVLRATIRFPCAPMTGSSTIGYDGATVRVAGLGTAGTTRVPFGAQLQVGTTTAWVPPAGCTPGEPR